MEIQYVKNFAQLLNYLDVDNADGNIMLNTFNQVEVQSNLVKAMAFAKKLKSYNGEVRIPPSNSKITVETSEGYILIQNFLDKKAFEENYNSFETRLKNSEYEHLLKAWNSS